MVTNSIDLTFIAPNVVTLTPNRRLAAFLQESYQQQQIMAGCAVWEKPAIYPINEWLHRVWFDFVAPQVAISQRVLTAIEQQLIWEKIILNSKPGALLIEVASTAKQAISAWNMLLQWNLPLEIIASPMDGSSDPAIFYTWAIEYQKKCNDAGWLDFYSMVNIVIKHIAEYKIVTSTSARIKEDTAKFILPNACYLIEHQELSPQYCRLFEGLEKVGVVINQKKLLHDTCADISVIPIESRDAEYSAVANWAYQAWHNDPNLRLGIIVHDLEVCRDSIESAFATQFTTPVYNIAAPRSINKYAIVDIALILLQLSNNTRITINDVSKLFRSTFIGGSATEILQRAIFTTILRNSNETALEYTKISSSLVELPLEHKGKCLVLEAIFLHWLAFLPTLKGLHSSEYWIQKIDIILTIWGWPGETELDENERQLHVCWKLLLQTYLQLDFVLKEHSFVEACKILQKLALTTPFLPESGNVAIHILGVLEAAGMPFDKLWVVGMDSNSWPMASNPNPFLPISIQRQFNLPRSSPMRELEVAKSLTNTFCRSGIKQVIFSFPEMDDAIPSTVSRLITQFKMHSVGIYGKALVPAVGALGMEELTDAIGPEFVTNKVSIGGSKTLKLQANCPFWAFAEIRLKALPMTVATIGLTPAERGELLHEALDKFWQQAKTSTYLQQTSAQDITELILSCVTNGLHKLQKKRPLTLTRNYIILETNRMISLINKWLLQEQQRTPFIVYKVEHQQLCRIGTLDFKVRMDRIDKLITGEVIIIDYKTGKVQVNEWFGERLQDPQLPLYCVATNLSPASIAFAVIRPDSVLFKGVANSADLLPGVAEFKELANKAKAISWDAQCADWQAKLVTLANEFQQGVATVQPLFGKTTCRYCSLQALCRIHEKETVA